MSRSSKGGKGGKSHKQKKKDTLKDKEMQLRVLQETRLAKKEEERKKREEEERLSALLQKRAPGFPRPRPLLGIDKFRPCGSEWRSRSPWCGHSKQQQAPKQAAGEADHHMSWSPWRMPSAEEGIHPCCSTDERRVCEVTSPFVSLD